MKINIFQPLAIHELGKRANQEDSIYPALGEADDNCRLFILCDGMGGHEHGEVASQTISRQMAEYLQNSLQPGDPLSDSLLASALEYAWDQLDMKSNPDSTKRMGTTLTLLYFNRNGCTAAHIGDSRIYHIRPAEHRILYKSRDHSLVFDLYQAGEISYDEMETSPKKNIITKAIVACEKNRVKPDVIHISNIKSGDVFYICSDGMLEQMSDEALVSLFASDGSDDEKRATLISETSDNSDNHSAYVVRIKDVSYSEEDARLVDEEPTARCNALNLKTLAMAQPPRQETPAIEVAEIAQPVEVIPQQPAGYSAAQPQMPRSANPYSGNGNVPPKRKGNKMALVFLALVVVLVAIALVLFAMFKSGGLKLFNERKEVKVKVVREKVADPVADDEQSDDADFDANFDDEAFDAARVPAEQKRAADNALRNSEAKDNSAGAKKNKGKVDTKKGKDEASAADKTKNDKKSDADKNGVKTEPARKNAATDKDQAPAQNKDNKKGTDSKADLKNALKSASDKTQRL